MPSGGGRGDIVRSDYEQQKLLDKMLEQEEQKTKYLKTVAKIPAYRVCPLDRRFSSFRENRNSHFDPEAAAREQKVRPVILFPRHGKPTQPTFTTIPAMPV